MTEIENPLARLSMPTNYKEMYDTLLGQLKEYDELLEATGDPKSASTRAVKKEIVEGMEKLDPKPDDNGNVRVDAEGNPIPDGWGYPVSRLIEQLKAKQDIRERVAFYYALSKALDEAFDEEAKNYVEEIVKSQPERESIKLADDQLKTLTDQRSLIYKNAKMLRDLAIGFKQDPKDFPPPPTRSTRNTQQRAITGYTWKLDGVPFSGDEDNLTAITKKYPVEPQDHVITNADGTTVTKKYNQVASLKRLMAKQMGLEDLKEPPDTLIYNYPDGKTLQGIKKTVEDVSSEGENEDEDESENEAPKEVV